MRNLVFIIAATIIVIFVLWGGFSPEGLADSSERILNLTTEKFGWCYLLATFNSELQMKKPSQCWTFY